MKAVEDEKKFIGLKPVRERLLADSKNVVLNQAEVDKKDHFNLNPTTPTFNNSKRNYLKPNLFFFSFLILFNY